MLSIIIPFYDRFELLGKALQSVIDQEGIKRNIVEVILIDDFSSEMFQPPESTPNLYFKIIRNQKNVGVGRSRQIGIDCASGDYLFFLDSDDYWHRNNLLECLIFIKKTNTKIMCSSYNIVKDKKKTTKSYEVKRLTHRDFKYINPVGFSTFAIERQFLIESGIKFPPIRKRNDFVFLHYISKLDDIQIKGSQTIDYNSLSGMTTNKMSLIPFQWETYRNYFNYSIFKSIYSLLYWILHHIIKSLLR